MTGLSVGQRGIASLGKGEKGHGKIADESDRKWGFLVDGEARLRWLAKSKVKPESTRKPTAKLEPPAQPANTARQWAQEELGRMLRGPIPKPELPELCPAWLAMVRKKPCCNCLSERNVQAHHEGKKDAAFQKVRDTLALNLGLECHSVYTQTNRLPRTLKPSGIYGDADLHTREQSLSILRNAQEHLLTEVLALLDQQDRIELLSKGLARVRDLAPLLGRIERAA